MLRNGLSFLKSFVIRFSVPGSGRSSGWPENRSTPPPDFSPSRYDVSAAPGPSGGSLAGFRRGALPLTGSADPPGAAGRSCWFRGLALSLLVAIAASAFSAPALAQDVTLVSNTGQGALAAGGIRDRAQAFTTGNNSGGYTLSSVDIISEDSQGDDATVSVCTVDGSGYPTTTCTALTAPSSFVAGTLTFTASPSMTLASNTTYSVLIGTPGGDTLGLGTTSSDGEDTGGAAGWSLANSYHFKNSSNVWGTTSSGRSFRVTIKGTIVSGTNNPPISSDGTVTATEDTDYTFTAANFNFADTDAGAALSSVKITSLPATGKGTLEVDGTAIAVGDLPKAVTKVDIDASKLTYSPPANASGDDYVTFQFKVNDGTDDSAAASTMTINVTAVNDAPTVENVIPDQEATAGHGVQLCVSERRVRRRGRRHADLHGDEIRQRRAAHVADVHRHHAHLLGHAAGHGRGDGLGEGDGERRQQRVGQRHLRHRGQRGCEHPRDGRADDHGHAAGRADADGGHHRHHGYQRADRGQLHVPVDPGGRG